MEEYVVKKSHIKYWNYMMQGFDKYTDDIGAFLYVDSMAEDCSNHFGLEGDNGEIVPEYIQDIAEAVALDLENHKIIEGS